MELQFVLGTASLVLGAWIAFAPKGFIAFKIKAAKAFGVKILVSKKTYTFVRYIGIALVVAGAWLVFVR